MSSRFKNLDEPDNISQELGLPAPFPFASFLIEIYEICNGNIQETTALFERLTGILLEGYEARYQSTPPELFPFASMGGDGVHYGYIIRAPEITAEDYPVGEFCPMDGNGVILDATTTRTALEIFAGDVMKFEEDEKQRKELKTLYKQFGIRPNLLGDKIRYTPRGFPLRVIPKTPVGWHYVPSSDGIGVLAPSERFRDEPFVKINQPYAPDEFFENADKALQDGFPATALYYLREGYWNNWTDPDTARNFSSRLEISYLELDRPLLAKVTVWRKNTFFKQISRI